MIVLPLLFIDILFTSHMFIDIWADVSHMFIDIWADVSHMFIDIWVDREPYVYRRLG